MSESTRHHLASAVGALEGAVAAEQAQAGSAVADRDFAQVKVVIARAERLEGMIAELEQMIDALPAHQADDASDGTGRRDLGRLAKGVKTPQEAFRIPILRALVSMGGRGKVSDVLDRVEPLVAGQLRAVDREPLPSDHRQPRWRNSAQWARLELVTDGLLRSDSPRGVWEISEEGRRLLRGQDGP